MRFTKADCASVLKQSFLNFVSDEEIEALLAARQIMEVDRNEKVPRDDAPTTYFFVLDGEIITRQRGLQVDAGRFDSGQCLELRTLLLRSQSWQFDWLSETKSHLMTIPSSVVEAVLQKYPQRLQYLARITQSIALQRLKRDLIALGVSRDSVISLIAIMKPEKAVDALKPEVGGRGVITVLSGEIVVQIDDDERPTHIMTLRAGDTTVFDPRETQLKYSPSEGARLWIAREADWLELAEKEDFGQFLSLFGRHRLAHHRDLEQTKMVPLKTSVFGSSGQDAEKAEVPNSPETAARLGLFERIRSRFRPIPPPVVLDENQTGMAVLVNVLERFRIRFQESDLWLNVSTHQIESDLEGWKKVAESLGFSCSTVRWQDQVRLGSGPLVVRFREGFSLLLKVHKNTVTVGDFNRGGYRTMTREELASRLVDSSAVWVRGFDAKRSLLQRENSGSAPFGFRTIFRFLLKDTSALAFLFLSGFFAFLADMAMPVLTQGILDQVVVFGRVGLLGPLVLVLAAATIVSVFFTWYMQNQSIYLTSVLGARLRALAHSIVFRQTPQAVFKAGAAQIMGRVVSVDAISGYVVNQVVLVAFKLVFMLGALSVLWVYHPHFVYICLILAPAGYVFSLLLKGRVRALKREESRLKVRESRILNEHFSSPDEMKTLRATLRAGWRWDLSGSLIAKNLLATQKLQGVFQVFQLMGSEGCKIVCFFYGFMLFRSDVLTLGQLMAVAMITPRVVEPIQAAVAAMFQYQSVRVMLDRLNDLLLMSRTAKFSQLAAREPFELKRGIRVESVDFQYESGHSRLALSGVDLSIQAGEVVAVVGPMGAGKSTLAYVLAGLYRPISGSVKIDATAIETIVPSERHRKIALVEQDGQIFGGTILSNIALGQEVPDLDRAVQCAQIAGVNDDILGRPNGYGGVLVHGGVGLSEGQKQRLLIARALYNEPEVLILDEATSCLDPISEGQVIKSILEVMKGKTVIFLTQRIQITTRVERVFYLEAGRLLESGTHVELIRDRNSYFSFYLKHLSIS